MRRGRPTTVVITLTPNEVATLSALWRRTTLPAGVARRARTLLLLNSGETMTTTAAKVGIDRRSVHKLAQAWHAQGMSALIERKHGPPCKPSLP